MTALFQDLYLPGDLIEGPESHARLVFQRRAQQLNEAAEYYEGEAKRELDTASPISNSPLHTDAQKRRRLLSAEQKHAEFMEDAAYRRRMSDAYAKAAEAQFVAHPTIENVFVSAGA